MSSYIQILGKFIPKKEIQKSVDQGEELGSGEKGYVHKGYWRGAPITIKRYGDNLRTLPVHLYSEFDPYLKADHPYILKFYGICNDPDHFSVITELMPMNLLHFWSNKDTVRTWFYRTRIAEQIVTALDYLHSKEISHGNIKPASIFLTRDFHAKLGNINLPKIKLESGGSGTMKSCTVRYRDPLSFGRGAADKSVPTGKRRDIYALGLVYWAMEEGKEPFFEKTELDVVRIKTGTLKEISPTPPIKEDWVLGPLIQNMLNPVPEKRPSAQELMPIFRKLSKQKVFLYYVFKSMASIPGREAAKDVIPTLVLLIERVMLQLERIRCVRAGF